MGFELSLFIAFSLMPIIVPRSFEGCVTSSNTLDAAGVVVVVVGAFVVTDSVGTVKKKIYASKDVGKNIDIGSITDHSRT